MDVTDYTDTLEARVAFKRLTGLNIRLTPFESITKIAPKSETEVVVQIITHQAEERRTEWLLTARGIKLVRFVQSESGTWAQVGKPLVMWDDDFERVSIPLFGPGKTPGEWLQAREFARMCYRPGTSNFPMDNHQRTQEGYTTARMARHW